MQLNENLLKGLPRILCVTHSEISAKSNIAIATWYRIFKTPSKITVQQLLDLANGFHVPASRFIINESMDDLGQREDYVISSGYKKCYYDSDMVRRVVSSGKFSTYRYDPPFAGMRPNRVKDRLLMIHHLPVTRLLLFCSTLNLNPFEFIVDPNTVRETNKQVNTTSTPHMAMPIKDNMAEDYLAMRLEIYELRKQLFDTKQDISILRRNQNPNNMTTNEIKAPVIFYSGIRFLYDTTDLTEPLHTWFQKLIVKTPYDTFFFAKTGAEYNSIRFFTEDNTMFYEAKCDSDLANLLFREGIIPGKICAESVEDNSSIIELSANLVANAREDRNDTADFAMFKKKMIQKFG